MGFVESAWLTAQKGEKTEEISQNYFFFGTPLSKHSERTFRRAHLIRKQRPLAQCTLKTE